MKNGIHEKYRTKLKDIFDSNSNSVSVEMLEEFKKFLRDNLDCDAFKLYRYSPADYFNIRNFETGKIKLTNNGVQNDVFEGVPQGITHEHAKQISDIVYMKCFTTEPNNQLMWAHYADNNKGICVEYDLALLNRDNLILKHIFPIMYEQERLLNLDNNHISNIIDAHKWLNYDIAQGGIDNYEPLLQTLLLFLFKSKAWEYENEWRIIFTKADLYSNNYTDFSNLTIDFDCATGIYLGYRINSEIKNNIIEIVDRSNCNRKEQKRNSIAVYESKLSNSSYSQEFTKIH